METNSLSKNEWLSAAAARLRRNRFATAHIPRSVSKPPRKLCRNRRNNRMKRTLRELVALLAAANLTALSGQVSPERTISGEHVALVGGTVINPADGKITRNATIFIVNGRITNIAVGMVMKFSGRTIN